MRIVAWLFFVYACSAFGEVAQSPLWSLPSLQSIVSYHDGANCYNAVLAAKGYNDFLVHSDSIELRFFLEKFCNPRLKAEEPGDVLTVLREGTLEHAAIFIDQGLIFDKNSISGLFGRFDDRSESGYRIKERSHSAYFAQCNSPDCQIQVYSCPSSSIVRGKMRQCFGLADQMEIRALQAKLQSITLNKKEKFDLDDRSLNLYRSISDSLDKMRGNEECALYILFSASSIDGHIWSLNEERGLGNEWHVAMDRMRLSRILAKSVF